MLRKIGRLLLSAGLGAVVGGGGVLGALYHQAELDVRERLSRPVWSSSARVLSAPMELWAGLQLSPDELAADLQAAGYARVARADAPGDFEVNGQDVLIRVPAAKGPGWDIAAADAHVAFKGGRVQAVSPKRRLTVAPVELAELRGESNEARRPVRLEDLPAHVVQAVLAMEDARFYQHEGLDPLGVLRALVRNLTNDGPMQGGSTLTQQLVKNLLLTQERTWERKFREALLAIALDQNYAKDDILELYLNEIYLGQAAGASICGVDQAARAYFGKPAARLTVGEAATLAGIVSAPNRYSPLLHPDRAKERRDLALDRMVQTRALRPEAAEAEKARPIDVHPSVGRRRAPWLVDAAVAEVEAKLGEGAVAARGLTVHTGLQPALQRLAEAVVAAGAAELDEQHPKARGAQIALVAVRVKDGEVVALVGGRDYGQSQFNRVLDAHRQVGSTVKPLTALAALDADRELHPMSMLDDSPIERRVSGKTWAPGNYDGTFRGPVTLRQAIAQSRNIPAVLLAERVGMSQLAVFWRRLGLVEASDLPASALGAFSATPLEVAAAYTIFPGQGKRARPVVVTAVTEPDGTGAWAPPPRPLDQASARAAFLATRLLQAVMDEGTGRKAASYGATGALGGKSGTTDDNRDAWFVGFSPELAVAVWVGFDKGRAVGLTGSEAALPTFARFVAGSGTLGGAFSVPAGVVSGRFCADTGAPDPDDSCARPVTEYLTEGVRVAPPPAEGPLSQAWDRLRDVIPGPAPAERVEPTPEEIEADRRRDRRERRRGDREG